MIQQEKDIYIVYQEESLFLVLQQKAREGIHAFNDYLLEKTKAIYQTRAFKGSFIQSVNGIKQRSAIRVGEFLNDGREVQSVTLCLNVTALSIEKMGILPMRIIEENQSSSSDEKKIISATGVDSLEMVRAFVQVTKPRDRPMMSFSTGRIVPIICENVTVDKNNINVEGSLYYPRLQQAVFKVDIPNFNPESIQPVVQQIKLIRTKLNSFPQKLHAQVV